MTGTPKFVSVPVAESLAKVGTLEPVVAEPVEVGELLVGQLIDLAVRRGGEAEPDEVVEIERRQRKGGAVTGDPVGQRHGAAITPVGADKVAVVDVGVVKVAAGAHLRLQTLDQFALPNQIVDNADVGDLAEGASEVAGLVLVGVERFRDHVDLLSTERLRGAA